MLPRHRGWQTASAATADRLPRAPRRDRFGRMRLRARSSALCLAFAAGALTGCAAERRRIPSSMTGARRRGLVGTAPGDVVAFRWLRGAGRRCPCRSTSARGRPQQVYNGTASGLTELDLHRPGDVHRARPGPDVDADDEIAFMGSMAGSRRRRAAAPPASSPARARRSGSRDAVGDPTAAYVYLFRQTGGARPGRGAQLRQLRLRPGLRATTRRPTSSPRARTPRTRRSRRRPTPSTSPTAGSTTAADHGRRAPRRRHPRPPQGPVRPGNCVRSEDTFDAGEGAFIVNKSGPVRAMRAYIGANSGPYTERLHIFYARREDITTVPARPRDPGRHGLLRLQPRGERDDLPQQPQPGGVTIDGVPDTPVLGR